MKTLKTLAFALLVTLTGSCQKKQPKMLHIESFEYQATLSCPKGYPIEVYRGFLEWEKDGIVHGSSSSLNQGTRTGIGGWGSTGAGLGPHLTSVPNKLNCIWVSYAEDCFYSINCSIDYQKMVDKFKEGFQHSGFFFNKNGTYKLMTYNYIVVGFAPGGVVVVWLSGSGKQVEIGRYKGQKIEISPQEIATLDNHDRLMFQQEYRKKTMSNERIVPPEVQKANAGKPIPYGLWDTYRTRYWWRPTFIIQREGAVFKARMEMFNGENESLFDQTLVKNEFELRAIPKRTVIGWRDNTGQNYSGTMDFDEKEIFEAFKEMYKDDKDAQAELMFEANMSNNYITVLLQQGDKKIRLTKTEVDIFKADSKY